MARLHTERDRYEETMKKAFMRGVCALNLEAMTMFHEGDEDGREYSKTPVIQSPEICIHDFSELFRKSQTISININVKISTLTELEKDIR